MTSPMQYQPIAGTGQIARTASQATLVEQSRAVAEVQAAVLVAQQCRRIKDIALAEMRESTAQKSVAERAFFKFPRGGQSVSGPSVHLARELARCWGNITYGITELRRDDAKRESEMQSYAWDLETNARNSTTFIVPHKRDTKSGAVDLTDLRDIYENSANQGARRLRENIFAILPSWFIDEATERCQETLTKGGDVPLAHRIANAVSRFESIGVVRAQLEAKLGRPSGDWTARDVADLGVTFQSIQRNEVTIADEFPPAKSRVTAEEIRGQQPAEQPDESVESAGDEQEPPVEQRQLNKLYAVLREAGVQDRPLRLRLASHVLDSETEISSFSDLTAQDADALITTLTELGPDGIAALVQQIKGGQSGPTEQAATE